MTTSDYRKVFKQLKSKPIKLKKYLKHNKPKKRNTGIAKKKCQRCGRARGHIDKYGLDICRHCFRDISTKIGFKKYN